MGKNAKKRRALKRGRPKIDAVDILIVSMAQDVIDNTMDVVETDEKLEMLKGLRARLKRKARRANRTWFKNPLPVQQEINAYVTGTGVKLVNTHERESRCDEGCVIHNPTDRTGFKTHWRVDRSLMERICSHGVGHPDPDDIRYKARRFGVKYAVGETVHGCDGCCNPNERVFQELFKRERSRETYRG